jgi:hypothetical protein
MPETIDTQFDEVVGYARDNARLARAAQLRGRGDNRTVRRRGGAALLGTAVVAAAVSLGTTVHTTGASPQATASSKPALAPASATTPYTGTKIGKVTLGRTVPSLAGVNLTPAQIAGLEKLHLGVVALTTPDPSHPDTYKTLWLDKHPLSAVQGAELQHLGLSAAQIAALQ